MLTYLELENLRAEETNKDDRNREGVDLHMKMTSITEDLRKSGNTECLSDIQIKNLVRTSMAGMMKNDGRRADHPAQ